MGRLLIITLLTMGVDQLSKYYIYFVLNLEEIRRMVVVPSILNFHLAWNEGINFGLFGNGDAQTKYIWITLALIIVVFFYWYAYKQEKTWDMLIPIGLITGGALGNTLDRVIFGAVMDYLNVACCGIKNPFSFNLADTAIFSGLVLMLILNYKNRDSINLDKE